MSTVIDQLIRIKNGYMAERKSIIVLYSKMNEEILKILEKEGYIGKYMVIEDEKKKNIEVELKYVNKTPTLTEVKLHSTPGKRSYKKLKDIKPVLGGLGISIISTSKGMMTGKEAVDQKLGGEIICSIW